MGLIRLAAKNNPIGQEETEAGSFKFHNVSWTAMKNQTNGSVSLREAKERAAAVARSGEFAEFLKLCLEKFPWRFRVISPALERDYLRVVDHHLEHLLPRLQPYVGPNIHRVLDFGCGSGGSAIALAMVYPQLYCHGTDIDSDEIMMARQRAKLYGVEERCEFHHIGEGYPLPFADASFDFCQCSSVLEYVVDREARKFCVQEMARLIPPGGLLFVSVANRLYPFEIHTRKWGWNYFPWLFHARIVDSTFWEVQRLARPTVLKLHHTPLVQLFRPWSNFCLRRESV